MEDGEEGRKSGAGGREMVMAIPAGNVAIACGIRFLRIGRSWRDRGERIETIDALSWQHTTGGKRLSNSFCG